MKISVKAGKNPTYGLHLEGSQIQHSMLMASRETLFACFHQCSYSLPLLS